MFGKSKDNDGDNEKDNAKFDPQIGTVLDGLKSLTLPQLAAAVMAKCFTADYQSGDTGWDVASIAGAFSPYPAPNIRDTTIKSQQREAAAAADPTSNRAKWLQIKDLVTEGLQALEKASLVVQSDHFTGVATDISFTTTRAGRDAISQHTVETVVAAS
jgi:hypothetical protein